jgi:hypothetical protein
MFAFFTVYILTTFHGSKRDLISSRTLRERYTGYGPDGKIENVICAERVSILRNFTTAKMARKN